MGIHPYDVIKSERWSFGLFTSFTLNLGFFETVVQDAWRAKSSRELVAVVDQVGYTQSLEDHRAAGAGQRYRIVPIKMSTGIFHPKIGFLANDDHAVLLVGSGNLTFGGWGTNLEFVDIVDSKITSGPFEGFRDFLLTIIDRRSQGTITVPDVSWISTALSKIPNANTQTESTVRFVHSLQDSIGNQIKAFAQGQRVDRLTVLSPYYDKKAESVDTLSSSLGASETQIVTGSKGFLSSPFPFQASSIQNLKTVALSASDARPIHAKWIDVQTETEILTVTGSVNATSSALYSTRNAEVAIFRVRPIGGDKYFDTESCERPIHVDPAFKDHESSPLIAIYAKLEADNRIRGTILDKNPAGDWEANLIRPGGVRLSPTNATTILVAVSSDGNFVIEVSSLTNMTIDFAAGLQLHLRREGRLACGWLHSEIALHSSAFSRFAGVVVGLFERNGVDSNLRDFAVEVLKAVKNGLPSSHFASAAVDQVQVKVGFGSKVQSGHDKSIATRLDLIGMLFARLGNDLTRSRSAQITRPPGPLVDAGADDRDDKSHQQKDFSDKVNLTLEDMHERLERAACATSRSDPLRATLLVIWFDCTMAIHVRSGEKSAAEKFLKRWRRAALSSAGTNKPKLLEPNLRRFLAAVNSEEHNSRFRNLFIMSILLDAVLAENDKSDERFRNLHEYLDEFLEGEQHLIQRDQLPDQSSDIVVLLVPELNGDYRLALAKILSTPTKRTILSPIIDQIIKGAWAKDEVNATMGKVGKEILSRAKNHERIDIKKIGRSVQNCPSCHLSLSPIREELQRDCLAICTNCRTILAKVLP
jgi:hypothetical protein